MPGASLAGRPLSARVFAFKGDWPEFAKIWNSDRNSQNFGFWPVLRTRNRVCKCHPIGSAEKSPSVFGFYYTIYYTIFPGSSGPLWKRSQGPLDQESSSTMQHAMGWVAGAAGAAARRRGRRRQPRPGTRASGSRRPSARTRARCGRGCIRLGARGSSSATGTPSTRCR